MNITFLFNSSISSKTKLDLAKAMAYELKISFSRIFTDNGESPSLSRILQTSSTGFKFSVSFIIFPDYTASSDTLPDTLQSAYSSNLL